jgi:hypothetical protein
MYYYEPTDYRNLLIDVLNSQHEALSMMPQERRYWTRFDTEYLEKLMATLSNFIN